jgi:DNA-binding HxlR family transcriptional regulator
MSEPELPASLRLVGDRWNLWLLGELDTSAGQRFTDLAAQPGLSRRVLSERLRELERNGIVRTRMYSERPRRHRYVLTERGESMQRLFHLLVEVATGTATDTLVQPVAEPFPVVGQHPTDALLEGDPARAEEVLADTVLPLLEYDHRYRTQLMDTLEAYLDCNASISMAAERLFAHRHTVRYRLDRVRELTGLDVDSVTGREHLMLGLRARRIVPFRP